MNSGERNYAIDAIRTIAICLVIYIHVWAINPGLSYTDSFPWKIIDLMFGFSRLAVPVFFAISGWFIFSQDRSEQTLKLQKQIVKLTKLLLVATVTTSIAFLILVRCHLMTHILAQTYNNTYLPDAKALIDMLLFGHAPNADGPLWFLVSLIMVEILFWLAVRTFKNITWLTLPAFIFFLMTITLYNLGEYRLKLGIPSVLPQGFDETTWFVGFMWFSLGYFLAKYFKKNINDMSPRAVYKFAVITGLLYFYEYILQTSGAPLRFGPYGYVAIFMFTPLATAGILLSAARSHISNTTVRWLANLGQKYALGVFIIHLLVMQPIGVFFAKYSLLSNHLSLKFVATYSLTIIASFSLTALYYRAKTMALAKPIRLPFRAGE
jgi:surface polysaccharide O-acyltransferase-like enzyme